MGPGGLLFVDINKTDDGNMIQVRIRDNGPGIPDEVKSHIFDPFFTTKSEGTGLGLSVSNSIIVEHNGRIVLDSEPGKGTTFIISLPIVQEKT